MKNKSIKKFIYIFIVCSILILLNINQTKNKKTMWQNWAQNQECSPKNIYYPKNLEEVISIVNTANKNNYKLKVIGSGHSWSDIIGCPDYLIDLKLLNKILAVDQEKKQVKIQAGITLEKLNRELDKLNLALPNQAAVMAQTIAGVTSTATHGTGHTGTFADFIKELELLASNGQIYKLSQNSNLEWFKAAKVNLGALGIVISITLQCIPQFYLTEKREIISLDNLLQNYKNIHKHNERFQFSCDLINNKVEISIFNKIEKKLNNESYKILSSLIEQNKRYEEEISIPINNLELALNEIKNIYENFKHLFGNNYPEVFCRFVNKDSDSLLSPTNDQDRIFLSISTPPHQNYMDFYKAYEDALYKFDGRPHWGKINFLDNGKAYMLYRQNLEKFLQVKDQLDPNGMFSNDFTLRIFKR